MQGIRFSEGRFLDRAPVRDLYDACGWSSVSELERLMEGLAGSHALVTAWDAERLVGLGNSISDGHLVVCYPHLLVLPSHRGRGIGRAIMERLMRRYVGLHQQVVMAAVEVREFYSALGFQALSGTEAMWIRADSGR